MRGHGCKHCSIAKTHEDFMRQFLSKETTIIVLDKYKHSNQKIKCQCKICNYIFYITPHQLLKDFKYKCGCSKCNASCGESSIISFLDTNNIDYEWQVEFDELLGVNNGKLSYDFYLPKSNLLIEYQGEQHIKAKDFFGGEDALKVQQEHDRRKRKYAKDNNYKLLEIWYWDFENIDQILRREIENSLLFVKGEGD